MQPSKKRDEPAAAEDEFLDEYINAEAAQDLEERQNIDQVGRQALRRRLRQQTSTSPKLTGGDIDAAWDEAGVGEETIGGATPTPDQDVVDEIGEGAGLTYQDDEPLNYAKVSDRDRHRWELNPASVGQADGDEPDEEEEDELDELAELDGEGEEEDVEVLDVDDLAEEVDEEDEYEDVDDELDELDELDDLDDDDEDDEDEDEDEP